LADKTVALVTAVEGCARHCSNNRRIPQPDCRADWSIRLTGCDTTPFVEAKIMKKTTSNYPAGYGRPPVEHQFKPGQSGNPNGRPKGVVGVRFDLLEELAGFVSIKDGETSSVKVTRQRAIIKVLVQAALAGDQRAVTTILNWSSRAFGSKPEPETDETESDSDDQAIAEASEERQRKRDGESS
jgi:hypothetical protein